MFLVCALLFTTVFSYSMIANASSSFTPRLDAPSYSNDYYYRNGETGGHVAVVEKVENGTVTFSNSAWGWENFYLTYADVNDPAMGESGWNFQGFIYLGDFGKNNNNNDDNGNDTITFTRLK